jgi:TonB family protein
VRWPLAFFLLASAYLLGQDSTAPLDWHGWLNQGLQDLKNARYPEAIQAFQKAVDLNPDEVSPRLYLARVSMSQYIPGAETQENLDLASKAETEFNMVLRIAPNNGVALRSLASLLYYQAQGIADWTEKFRKLDESVSWNQRVLVTNPRDREAYYSIAAIDWVQWYMNYMRARADLGMTPEEPGPFPNATVRARLKQQYSAQIEHGISYLEKALQIDPRFSDAMAYMDHFIRERADLRDTPAEYQRDIEEADQWARRAIEARNSQTRRPVLIAPLPPPPPSPPTRIASHVNSPAAPQRIHNGNFQQYQLIRKVDPEYPPMAKEARIQGVVRFTVIVGNDGRVANAQLVSGHPLLVEAARQVVYQWEYEPTLLNGEPVEVVTHVDVNFALGLPGPQ